MLFLQEVAGVSIKHTDKALTRREIMVAALPGRPPGHPTVLLAALEDLIKDSEAKV